LGVGYPRFVAITTIAAIMAMTAIPTTPYTHVGTTSTISGFGEGEGEGEGDGDAKETEKERASWPDRSSR